MRSPVGGLTRNFGRVNGGLTLTQDRSHCLASLYTGLFDLSVDVIFVKTF